MSTDQSSSMHKNNKVFWMNDQSETWNVEQSVVIYSSMVSEAVGPTLLAAEDPASKSAQDLDLLALLLCL